MNKLLFVLFTFIAFLLFPDNLFAASNRFITIVNPIRGDDFFQLEGAKPEDNFKNEWEEVKKRKLSATWLLRPDALIDKELVSLAKTLDRNQELGLFMEVTPAWTKLSGVEYRQGQNWHSAGSVFLTGYEVSERRKLIDGAFEKFKEVFGGYPKSVGAWWIDANSLSYMKEKYEIVANMDVADQYSTDNYQVWGQYFSTPFYPSKKNALMPASSIDQKIEIVTIQWANRDPFNSFGNGVLDSTYSVQANDYANKKFHSLNTEYFKKLITVYLNNPYSAFGHVTVGLENDFSWELFGEEYKKQLDVVLESQKNGASILTMSDFAHSYMSQFPKTSPPHIIFAKDPLGSNGYVLWYQNTKYRMGWFYNSSGSVIKDLRLFFDSHQELCLEKSCEQLNLATAETGSIDDVTYKNGWTIDEGRISDIKLRLIGTDLELTYTNQVGFKRSIKFLQNDISLDSQILPIPVWISRALDKPEKLINEIDEFGYQLIDSTAQIWKQVKNLFTFILFSLFAFYLPGAALLKKANIEKNHKFFLTIPVGICSFTLLAFTLGYLNFSWGIIMLPVISILFIGRDWILPKLTISKESLMAGILIIAGSLTWLATTVKNGLIFDYGMGFWGPHGHDAIWHIGLIEALKKGVPPENPAFSGDKLLNYHYFYDLLLAQASNFTGISSVDLYFRFFPILLSVTIGVIVYILAITWFKSKISALFAVFFIYFGGSFGWIITFLKDESIGGETAFWAQQGISTLINPPFAISLLIFLTGLFFFRQITEQKIQALSMVIPLVILWGSLIEFKAYAGILVLGTLVVVSIAEVFKRNIKFLIISIPIGLISFFVFYPNNSGSASLLVISPFWLVHSMIDSPDRVGFYRLQLARMAGVESGNWFKFIASEGIGLMLFLAGNLGTRIIGLFAIRNIWPVNIYNLFIFVILILSILLPLSFTQKGASFNTIQFFYYFLIISAFLAASGMDRILKKFSIFGWILIAVLVLATIPTSLGTLMHYLPQRPPARISSLELEALNFLRSQPDGVVLSYFYDKNLRERFNEPIPLLAYESTMYLSALTGKSEYVADTVNLNILGIDYKGRLQVQKDIYSFKEPEMIKKFLKENNIKYIYLPRITNTAADETFGMRKIFENEEVILYSVI
ncbi:hypothetical protein A3B39_00015 [Candidatus Daviesbacteria bacterium RIFCSPLOWO2_01_FULL_37_10]|nr:MAG: hypothetical protein A3B39_00015 [Candidatus Daviesbacteria bacterium RIFCSPLOWO2_01_FULL_37_10]